MYFFDFFISFILFFSTLDAHLFVTALYVLKLRSGGNPHQVRNVDNEYVELSNLQQARSFCPQGPNTRQHNKVKHAKQEREGTPIKQCKFKWAHSQNCEKRLLAWSFLSVRVSLSVCVSKCLSVRPHATIRLPKEGFSSYLICDSYYECHEKVKLLKKNLTRITRIFVKFDI
jgi:hypothetical protein